MSTPITPSSIIIYKIVKDYEEKGIKIQPLTELSNFSINALQYACDIERKDFWVTETPELREDLEKICDITFSFCIFNEAKYNNGGKEFAQKMLGLMPYSWLKGAEITLQEYEQTKTINEYENIF